MGRLLRVMLSSCGLIFLLAGPVLADLTVGDSSFGPGTLTFDSQSQLMWLDVTVAQGRSYDDISSKFGAGGEFEGFRYATANELSTLFSHATSQTAAGFLAMQVQVGVTKLTASQSWTTGVAGFSDLSKPNTHKISSIRVFLSGSVQLFVANGGDAGNSTGNSSWGHWLVSETLVSVETSTWGSIKGLYQ